ncbi:MAG: flagellar basal body rod protein FlgB [Nitrospinaceae bacterium]|nr:flagellar basal body rod protein FlgB [Nitrospina sp.]MBT5869836.1 flagellar basal body rod protein FlgB [Nitrospinaceae bacterium]MBT6347283.1 flagellar basal body rod protein FlgB [Nitrospina sp.]
MPLIDRILYSDKVPKMMVKSLDMMSTRQNLISSNISNVDTPGFKASDIDFQAQLREAMGSKGSLNLRATNSKHFGPSTSNIGDLSPDPFEESSAAKANGNNVDIDNEMAKMAENQIIYNATVQLMMKRGSTVRSAVTELPQQ